MAKLHEYVTTSDSSGYYIYGILNDEGHTTIQVTKTAKRLFDYIDLCPGETIPQKLLRALLDANLLYTGRGRIRHQNQKVRFDTDETKAELSDEQFQKLLQFLQSYQGPDNDALKQLAKGLEIPSDEIPTPQDEIIDESSGPPDELKAIAEDYFPPREERLREKFGPKLREIPGNATVDAISQLSDGWTLIEELSSFDGQIQELDVLDGNQIRYQVRVLGQDKDKKRGVFTIIQDTTRLTGSDTPDFTVIAERSVPLPPARECDITHRIQISNGQVQDWTLTGKIGSYVPVETAKANLKSDRDRLFRQLLNLSESLPTFEFSQQNPYEVELEYAIEDMPL